MTDPRQITDLPVATTIGDADLFYLHQGVLDKQVTVAIAMGGTLKVSANLSDLASAATARTNLSVPAISDVAYLINNLSDLPSKATARANLSLIVGTNIQAWATQLDAVAANNSTTGFHAQTGTNTVASRTLGAPAAGLTISNPAGIAGNPTFALANDLAAVEGLASNGIAVRTATDAWAIRSLAQPSAGLTITNTDGVSGNPTFVLANDLAALEGLASTGFAVRTTTDTWAQRTLQPGSSKLSISNPTGAAGDPSLDVVEANLNMNNTGTVLAIPKGGLGISSATAYGLLAAGTTSTGNAQVIAPVAKGSLLRSNGTSALPVLDSGILPITGVRRDFGSGINNAGYPISCLPYLMPASPENSLRFTFPASTTGALMYFPLFLPVDITITNNCRYRYATVSLTVGKEITCALYIDSGVGTGPTGSPIANTTITQVKGGSTAFFPSSTLLSAGLYWVAISCNEGSATMSGYKNGPGLISFNPFIFPDTASDGLSQGLVGWKQNFTYSTTFPSASGLTEIFATDRPGTPQAPAVPFILLSSN